MNTFERQLIRRLVAEPEAMSRNRNFHAFEDPVVSRARRVARHLRSIRRSVLAAGDGCVRLARTGEAWSIRIVAPGMLCTRDAFVADIELEMLCEDAKVAGVLAGAADQARRIA